MKLFPAIDILEGGCVRLYQGDFGQRSIYERDPLDIALDYEEQGATNLHLVDLDGALAGSLKNLALLKRLSEQTKLAIDYGGGIKSKDDIRTLLDSGASQVSIGSSAVREPDMFSEWLDEFGEKVILSADVADGKVKIAGWQLETPFMAADLILKFKSHGLKYVSCTDVNKDGTMSGPSLALYQELVQQFPGINIIASGGVSSLEDLKALKQSEVYGAIVGKALLDGRISVREALKI